MSNNNGDRAMVKEIVKISKTNKNKKIKWRYGFKN